MQERHPPHSWEHFFWSLRSTDKRTLASQHRWLGSGPAVAHDAYGAHRVVKRDIHLFHSLDWEPVRGPVWQLVEHTQLERPHVLGPEALELQRALDQYGGPEPRGCVDDTFAAEQERAWLIMSPPDFHGLAPLQDLLDQARVLEDEDALAVLGQRGRRHPGRLKNTRPTSFDPCKLMLHRSHTSTRERQLEPAHTLHFRTWSLDTRTRMQMCETHLLSWLFSFRDRFHNDD